MTMRPWIIALSGAFLACTSVDGAAPREETTATAASDLRVPTLRDARASLLAADAARANEATLRGIDGFMAGFDDDAYYLARRENLLVGKAAIAGYFAAHPLTGTLGWRYARGDVSALGDFGYTIGWTEIIDPPDANGVAAVSWGIYCATWGRGADGAWKIKAFTRADLVGAPSPPPPELVPLTNDGPVYPRLQPVARTKREMMDTDTQFAALTAVVGRQRGFDAYVDDDGIQLTDPLQVGRKAIWEGNEGIPATATLAWRPVAAGAALSADLGFTIGTYEAGGVDEGGNPVKRYGKYLTVWKRQRDGSFKYVVDGGNSSPPPAP
jgi:ketosteroid isomerase-like protein